MAHDLIPLLAIFCIFGLPIVAYIINKVLAHQERIELIRRGFAPPPGGDWKKAAREMNAQMGPGPMPPPPYPGAPPPPPYAGPAPGMFDLDGPQRQLNKGIMVGLIGLAITIGMSFIGMDNSGPLGTPGFHPGPELLFGLIPMFVGLAQIITAVLGGAQFGAPGRARGFGAGGSGPIPPGPAGGPFSQPGRPYTPPPRPNPADELPQNNPLDRR
jgi:hypothetical protein